MAERHPAPGGAAHRSGGCRRAPVPPQRHDCPRPGGREAAAAPSTPGTARHTTHWYGRHEQPSVQCVVVSRRAHDLRDPEGLAAAAADDGGLGEYGRDDPDVAAAVADGLDADAAAGGPVAGGRAPEAAGRVRGGRGGVGLEGALQSVDGRAVATLGLGVERDQRETAAGMRFLGVVEAELLGDREESAVVVPARPGGVADSTRGGDAMDCLMEQSLEGEFVPAGGRRPRSGTRERQDPAARGGAVECRPTPVPVLRREQVVSVSCSRNDNEPECPCVPIPGHPK